MPRHVGHVSCVRTFPVKACKGVQLESCWCFYEGLEHDRRWAIVDDKSSECLDMIGHPSLSLVRPRLHEEYLCLDAPGMDILTISLPLQSDDIHDIREPKHKFKLVAKVRIARVSQLVPKLRHGFLVILIYQLTESRDLTKHKQWGHVAKKGDKDNWKNLFIGDKQDVQLRFLKRCGRCPITTVDPETGVKTGQEPLKTLRKTRPPLPENRKKEGYSPIFGVYFAVEKEGLVRVGDPVFECSETVAIVSCCDGETVMERLLKMKAILSRHKVRWILGAKELMFSNSLHSYFCSRGKVGDGVYQIGMDFALEELNHGQWIHVFPEGKIIEDGSLVRLKWGVGRLIAESNVTPIVLPIWHVGMNDVLPNKYPYMPHIMKKVTVLVGEPMTFDDILKDYQRRKKNAMETRKQITDQIENRFKKLKREADLLHSKWK
ncbi:hypothetical protein QZH41_020641 [Actinostola sp. cb2023]|nr:hypothetical protein QZH41_020641 [Actinostola sp. cb2023]